MQYTVQCGPKIIDTSGGFSPKQTIEQNISSDDQEWDIFGWKNYFKYFNNKKI